MLEPGQIAYISVSVIMFLVIIFANILFFVRFSTTREDTGIAPKIISLISFTLSFSTTAIIPISCVNYTNNYQWNDELMFLVFSYLVIFFLLVVIPFSLLFFKTDFIDTGTSYLKKRMMYASFGALITLFIYFVITLPLYFTTDIGMAQKTIKLHEYLIASIIFIGWFPFAVFLGIGISALPAYLFVGWYHRPSPILVEEYDRCREDVGKRAKSLREAGETIKGQMKSKNFLEKRKLTTGFKTAVSLLRDDYENLQIAYLYKGGNPIWPVFLLVMSVFSTVLAILWILQVVLFVFLTGKVKIDILGNIFKALRIKDFEVFSTLFYMLMALYLFVTCMFGLVQLSNFVPFLLAGYVMRSKKTTNDSFLVNSAILLLVSLPITHFCYISLNGIFAGNSSGSSTFKGFFDNLETSKHFKSFYKNQIFFIIIGVSIIVTLVLYYFFPPVKSKKCENALKKIGK